ncbi:MAG TPA: methylenetetrahydrofolate reductase, partial [Longimicrobiaceae bacterium]|nr:methylenetetrahydrofolate reductase [Longimicrobiaceae bacterium]
RMIRQGVRFVGGCCGTTPEHIRHIAGAVRMLAPGAVRVSLANPEPEAANAGSPPVPLAERSNWGRKLAAREFVTTVEIVPPRGVNPEKMLQGVRLLKDAGVDAVNVPDGPRAQSRMGVIATSLLIQQRVGIEAVMHYCCRDRNLLGMLSDLLGAQALGLRNLLLITGDPPKMGPYPEATAVFDIDSIGLTNLVSRLNRGLDPGGSAIDQPTGFVAGVGVNPGAADFEQEMRRFYWKVEAGAEYAITQPVFDLRQLFRFLDHLEKEGIRIPVVAGIWPLVSARNAEFLANEVPGVVVPDEVVARMRRASEVGKEAAVEEGICIAQQMLREARERIRGAQVSAPFGKVPLALRVFEGAECAASANALDFPDPHPSPTPRPDR